LAKVFVVDDEEDTRELYAVVLRHEGFVVATARGTEEALRVIDRLYPDVIVADYALPGADGFELCRRLKANPLTREIPLIIVTGYCGPAWQEQARQAGASRFLSKPLLPDDLVAAVRDALSATGDAGATG
jgi:CheY-like chemotaxis protein